MALFLQYRVASSERPVDLLCSVILNTKPFSECPISAHLTTPRPCCST